MTRDRMHREDRTVKMPCQNARSLVPSYLDGELTEERAAPLREHLLACVGCRETAKGGRNLKSWFQDAEAEIPSGFAARVARRAFAGDRGLDGVEAPAEERAGTLLPFLLRASTVAAAILFVLAISIQRRSLPEGDGLEAAHPPPWERQEGAVDGDASAPADPVDPADSDDSDDEAGAPERGESPR